MYGGRLKICCRLGHVTFDVLQTFKIKESKVKVTA